MSWELASFLILGAALLAGFAWYERSRPTSQVVALVAALAALAIAGRIAFAAFPNVKPTTDIVIFAGYALGPAPGFAVGGLTALVSNFWFGQGPWTPWQMAGWGLCGMLGAGAGGRSAARRPLHAGRGLRSCRHRLRRSAELLSDGDLRRRPLAAALPRAGVPRGALRRRPRDRQRDPRPGRRPGDDPDARPLPRALRVAERSDRSEVAPTLAVTASSCWRSPWPACLPARAQAADADRAAPPPGWSRRRTPTAAGAPRPDSDSSTDDDRLGDARASRRPGATRSTSRAAATPRSTTCAPTSTS